MFRYPRGRRVDSSFVSEKTKVSTTKGIVNKRRFSTTQTFRVRGNYKFLIGRLFLEDRRRLLTESVAVGSQRSRHGRSKKKGVPIT